MSLPKNSVSDKVAPSKSKAKQGVKPFHGSPARHRGPQIAKHRAMSREQCKACGKPFGRESWIWGKYFFYLDCPLPPEGCGGDQSMEMDCACLWDGSVDPDDCPRCSGTGESEEMHACPKCGGTGKVTEIWPCEGECHGEAWADGKKHPNSTSQAADLQPMLCSEVRAGYLCGVQKEAKKR